MPFHGPRLRSQVHIFCSLALSRLMDSLLAASRCRIADMEGECATKAVSVYLLRTSSWSMVRGPIISHQVKTERVEAEKSMQDSSP